MENNEILLKDLCSRLPYGVKLSHKYKNHIHILSGISKGGMIVTTDAVTNEITTTDIENVKPYLFPLLSMTDEQCEKFLRISGWDVDIDVVRQGEFSCVGYVGLDEIYDAIDWFNKNHFDYRGLIDMGLAIDATGKNIY
jgi:hypothetical protein